MELGKGRYDLLVVGAGIFGLASAYHYARRFGGEVIIIDSLGAAGQGNTARSVGGFRMGLFSSKLNRILSESTVSFFLDLQGSGYDLGAERVGYLVLLSEDSLANLSRYIEPIIGQGLAELLDAEQLKKRVPWIRTSFTGDEEAELMGLRDIKAALFSPLSGYLDVEKLVAFYVEKLEGLGVEFTFNTKVERLILVPKHSIGHPREPLAWQAKEFRGVETNRGVIEAEKIVVATGAWINELLDPVGIDAHVKPKKRQLFSIPARGGLEELFSVEGFNENRCLPMTFIPRGPYLIPRVRERSLWLGLSDDIGRPWGIDMKAEESFYIDNIYPIMSKIIPQLRGAIPESMWAGCYSINTIDENPIVFRVMNLVVATGGSGSGVMKSDAIGRVVAALLAGESEAELYGGERIQVEWLGIRGRMVEPEYLVF